MLYWTFWHFFFYLNWTVKVIALLRFIFKEPKFILEWSCKSVSPFQRYIKVFFFLLKQCKVPFTPSRGYCISLSYGEEVAFCSFPSHCKRELLLISALCRPKESISLPRIMQLFGANVIFLLGLILFRVNRPEIKALWLTDTWRH